MILEFGAIPMKICKVPQLLISACQVRVTGDGSQCISNKCTCSHWTCAHIWIVCKQGSFNFWSVTAAVSHLETFLIPSIERMFADDHVTFQDDNASFYWAKDMKTFLEERHIISATWPANILNLNPTENVWWKLKKMVFDKTPTCNADLVTAITESWSRTDE